MSSRNWYELTYTESVTVEVQTFWGRLLGRPPQTTMRTVTRRIYVQCTEKPNISFGFDIETASIEEVDRPGTPELRT